MYRSFTVDIDQSSATTFAEISGDWNPLHTDPNYAASTQYGSTILHGAFAAGLVSRMAGMEIPGRDCLLHGIKLNFVRPITIPNKLLVSGRLLHSSQDTGSVEVLITDTAQTQIYVNASYSFGLHRNDLLVANNHNQNSSQSIHVKNTDRCILVTGASGALGSELLRLYPDLAIRLPCPLGYNTSYDPAHLDEIIGNKTVTSIVHCGWPSPDNVRLLSDKVTSAEAVNAYVAGPLHQSLQLASILRKRGEANSTLVLIGSTAALPGRHSWSMPLYSIGKSLLPTLCSALSVELGPVNMRCVNLVFDTIDGGMNSSLSNFARIAHSDRSPFGKIPSISDAAAQIDWVLSNPGFMVSGSTIHLTGASIP